MTVLGAAVYIFLSLKEIYHQGYQIFFQTLVSMPSLKLIAIFCVSSRLDHASRMTVRIRTYVDVSLIAAYECNAVMHQVITSTRYERIIVIIFLICDMA